MNTRIASALVALAMFFATAIGPAGAQSNVPTAINGADAGTQFAAATPANSSHAAGTSLGGLLQVPLARTPQNGNFGAGSGIVTNFFWKSTGGSTGQILFRVWQKKPVNTTCTDNTAFAGSDTDDQNLITIPFTLTPAAPAVTTGDAATYAGLQSITWDYQQQDQGPGTQILYVCAVTVAIDTADQNHLVRVYMSGPQN